MRIIALEEHVLPSDIIRSAGLDIGLRANKKAAGLDEMGEGRLRVMDDAGIDIQVLSALGNTIQDLPPSQSVAVSRQLNDRMAETIAAYPDRFEAFATLPMTDPAAAVDELERSVEELRFLGAMIHGQTRGVFLDRPSVRPILTAAERLGVPIYLHPAPPPLAVVDTYYSGLSEEVEACLATSGWGWHSETAMHLLRMVAAGVFEALPDLKIIMGHMGEGLPFHLDRIESMLSPVIRGHSRTVAETLRQNLWLTTSGYNTTAPLLCALSVFGADHVMFSVDHPFANSDQATEFLRTAPVDEHDREKIAHHNVEALLGIGAQEDQA